MARSSTQIESSVRYLGIEVDDALVIGGYPCRASGRGIALVRHF